MTASGEVSIDGGALTIADVERAARGRARLVLAAAAREKLAASRGALEQALGKGEVLYGVNTGFGSLAQQRIDDDRLRAVQRNLVLSHASGVGEPLPPDVTRAMLILLLEIGRAHV